MNDTLVFIIIYGLLVCVAGLLAYWFLRMVMYRRDLVSEQTELLKKQNKILDDAHRMAQKIVDEAQAQSTEILSMRNEFLKRYQNEMEKIIQNVIEVESDELVLGAKKVRDESLILVQKEYDKFNKMLGDSNVEIKSGFEGLLADYGQEMKDVSQSLVTELRSYEEIAKKKIDEDMALYRQNLIKDMEDRIAVSVKELSVKILGKSLTDDDHEELVRKAIEAASKDGLFN